MSGKCEKVEIKWVKNTRQIMQIPHMRAVGFQTIENAR